jgi:hypothetical protein
MTAYTLGVGTLGTAGTTTLTSLIYNPVSAGGGNSFTASGTSTANPRDTDIATINALIGQWVINAGVGGQGKQLTPAQNPQNAGFFQGGQLVIPGRGMLKLQNGDYVAVDPVTGWPILLSNQAAQGASFVHT